MLSRAHLLIQREYAEFQKSQPWGMEAAPLADDTIFEWGAKVKGLKDTIWEGGVFRLVLKFDENYDMRPPQVSFQTIPFHPNVNMITGRPCIDFLDNYDLWFDGYTLTFILLSIQHLLSNPVLDAPVNPDAAAMLINSPMTYRQTVHECVMASQRVEAGLMPHEEPEPPSYVIPQEDNDRTRRTVAKARLSFGDYHNTWSGIATSKGNNEADDSLADDIEHRLGLDQQDVQDELQHQAQQQNSLKYGNFPKGKKLTAEELKAVKLSKLQQMKDVYLQPRREY